MEKEPVALSVSSGSTRDALIDCPESKRKLDDWRKPALGLKRSREHPHLM